MQRHYLTFRLLVWLKEKGITRRINFLISHSNDANQRNNPTSQMLQSQEFFSDREVKGSLENVMSYLADEKSCKVLLACIDYRTKRTPIPSELFSENDQYFVSELIHLKDGEIFVDGGAYTGDTIQQLLDEAKKQKVNIGKIYAFEPEENNYSLLSKFYGKRSNIKLIQQGLSDKNEVLLFNASGVTARIVDDEENATDKIKVMNLDSFEECKDVSFIKMDIEGAEWDALQGAKKLIVRNKPKLTIAIDEAIRVTKPGGTIVCAFISIFAIMYSQYFYGTWKSGEKENFTEDYKVRHFKEQLFTGYDVTEFEDLFAGKPVDWITTTGTDGFIEPIEQRSDFEVSDEDFEAIFKWYLAFSEKRELLGNTTHLLYICRKK